MTGTTEGSTVAFTRNDEKIASFLHAFSNTVALGRQERSSLPEVRTLRKTGGCVDLSLLTGCPTRDTVPANYWPNYLL
jgi:hypothetical protein